MRVTDGAGLVSVRGFVLIPQVSRYCGLYMSIFRHSIGDAAITPDIYYLPTAMLV